MAPVTFDEVLEAIEHLPLDQQADLLDVVRRRLAERGRLRVVQDVKEGLAEFERGEAKPASVDDIMRKIES
jgi:hypothetical protein